MCELLALNFNLPVTPRISFRGFRKRGQTDPDGWGIAFYPDRSAQVIKEPASAHRSPLAGFLQQMPYIKSSLILAHVRYSSVGKNAFMNTHPFLRTWNKHDYTFAHNGTIRNYSQFPLEKFQPVGQTDSEYIFCYLMDQIAMNGLHEFEHPDLNALHQLFLRINESGKFNCLLSDGEFLMAYHDKNGYKRLYYLERKPPYGRIKLSDEDWEVNLAEEKNPDQKGYIIASYPLTDENWFPFQPGELMVLRNGEIIFRNKN